MEEIFTQRKAELELAAKNTIVEIHLIETNAAEIDRVLESKEKLLEDIDAAIRELEHISNRITTTLAAAEREAIKEAIKEVPELPEVPTKTKTRKKT